MNQTDHEKLTEAVKKVLGLMKRDHLTQLKVSPKDLYDMARLGNVRISGLRSAVANILSSKEIVRGGYGQYGVQEAAIEEVGREDLLIVKQNMAHRLVIESSGTLAHRQ